MTKFFISDTHFGHHRLWESGRRIKHFDEKIIKSWKNNVKDNDTVIHLGDVLIANKRSWPYYLDGLPGKKILTVGNHDHESYSWYMDHGFDFACECFTWEIYGLNILFSHIPLMNLHYSDINIHGHLHEGTHRGPSPTDRHVLISMELQNYQLVTLESVTNKWMNK